MKKRARYISKSLNTSFPKPLLLRFVDNPEEHRRRFELTHTFEYNFQKKGIEDQITVQIGYNTDFASVPRPLWPFFPPVGRYGKAAVIHDHLCDMKSGDPDKRSRQEADLIFRQAMKDLKVHPVRIFCMYKAICLWTVVVTLTHRLCIALNIKQKTQKSAF